MENLSLSDYQDDVLIVAGDVSDMPELLARTFKSLVRRFAKVLFVPGNHELWVRRCGHASSFSKFAFLKQLTADTGVSMAPCHVGRVSIVPLFGWYDYSFGKPSEDLLDQWMDFRCCEWLGFSNQEVTRFFTDMNVPRLKQNSQFIISFSHFLPRIDTMPKSIPPKHRMIYPVLGSTLLEEQVRQLGSHVHIYGHSHVNRQVEKDGMLYINSAFGRPAERHISSKALYCVHEL